MASLKPTGLPPDSVRRRATNSSSPSGVEKAEWLAGETQSTPTGTPRVAAISALTLAAGSTPPCPGLAPCELDLDHLHLRPRGLRGEAFRIEATLAIAAAEVAGAELPDKVAATLQVVGRDRALAGVVVETAATGALVEGADRIGRQRAETHRRDVEHAGRIRLRAVRADDDAEVVAVDPGRRQRMVDPLVVHRIDVLQRAERDHVHRVLGATVDQRALLARERRLDGVAFDEVLAHLRADRLQPVAEVGQGRVVATQRGAGLQQVPRAQRHQQRAARHAPPPSLASAWRAGSTPAAAPSCPHTPSSDSSPAPADRMTQV